VELGTGEILFLPSIVVFLKVYTDWRHRFRNRYPGLMCDVESHIYLPLIEEMGYMPKRRYASGQEIRHYIESLCSKYELHGRAMFQSAVQSVVWNESTNVWDVTIAKRPKGGEEAEHRVHANFVGLVPGERCKKIHLLANADL
jgi:cation diffusion facilitator CzcD-associated flavoprotein CzcO